MLIIDDLSRPHPENALGRNWQYVADTVMGGVSTGTISRKSFAGREALWLSGSVSLENNGGFIQMATDLAARGEVLNASAFTALELTVIGNDESYNVHLRTPDVNRPWQSYRQSFQAASRWTVVTLPFADFEPYRLDETLDTARLVRLGIVAVGRAMDADVAISEIKLI
ncbi:MAG: CIA30 family protein [Pseudomonadota bacterium]